MRSYINAIKTQTLDTKENINFAENKIFFSIQMQPPLTPPLKKNIIQFLHTQNFDDHISSKHILNMLWGINDCTAMADKNNVYARCTDPFDMIIKMYHLALMTEQKKIARSIQDKMCIAMEAYFHEDRNTNGFHWFTCYKIISKIACALNCFDKMKSFLYKQCQNEHARFLPDSSFDLMNYDSFIFTMDNCGLLDKYIAQKSKIILETMFDFPNNYFKIVEILNKVSPHLITKDEIKHYVKTFLQRNSEDSEFMTFEQHDALIAGIMKDPYLTHDPEIFSMLLFRIKPDTRLSGAQKYIDKFSEYFEKVSLNPWQKNVIALAKLAAEEYYRKNSIWEEKELSKYSPTVYDEKLSKFSGSQSVFVLLKIAISSVGDRAWFIPQELLTQTPINFDVIANIINASLNAREGSAAQVGFTTSEVFDVLNQHSYYKISNGALAAKVIVDGSCLDYYSEADKSCYQNLSTQPHPVLKMQTMIKPEHILSLHPIDIRDFELEAKFPKVILNNKSIQELPNLFDKMSIDSKDDPLKKISLKKR